MKEPDEDALAVARRQVTKAEERVLHQEAVIEKLITEGRERETAAARIILTAMHSTLAIARELLRFEQEKRRSGSSRS